MFIFGSPEEMKARLDAYVEGGIPTPIITPITTPDKTGVPDRGAPPASGRRPRAPGRG